LEEAKAIARKANTISTVDEKEKEELFSPAEKYSLKTNNQKLGVVRALLKIGNWKDARTLMDMMPENYCLMFDDKVRRNICRLISIGIDEIYRGNSGLPSVLAKRLKSISTWKIKLFKPATTVREFIDTVVPLIEFLGPFIYSDSLLMIKLIRIFKVLVKKDLSDRKKKTSDCKNSLVSGDKEVEAGEEVVILDENSVDFEIPIEETNTTLEMSPELKGHMINILDECILPGLSLTESNCGLTEELWSLLRLLPYEIRYRLYQGWKRNPNNSLLLKKRALDLKKIKYYMKRLSKENVKPTGRQIGKLSHSNPSFLFDNVSTKTKNLHCNQSPLFRMNVKYTLLRRLTKVKGKM
jgi:THO complex subunit 2